MRVLAIVAGFLATILLTTSPTLAGPIYDFKVTSISGDTKSVSGFIEFDNKGYQWSDVVATNFAINGMEALSFFVGQPTGDYFDPYFYELEMAFPQMASWLTVILLLIA